MRCRKSLNIFHPVLSKHPNSDLFSWKCTGVSPWLQNGLPHPRQLKKKNFKNWKVSWEPVLCRHLRARYHSAVTNWKGPALKISATNDSITTVLLYLSSHDAWCYHLVPCHGRCIARTSLTWKWHFLGRELNFNFWFTDYIFLLLSQWLFSLNTKRAFRYLFETHLLWLPQWSRTTYFPSQDGRALWKPY